MSKKYVQKSMSKKVCPKKYVQKSDAYGLTTNYRYEPTTTHRSRAYLKYVQKSMSKKVCPKKYVLKNF